MTKDIFYNLATEEYLLKHKDEDFFMIWQSEGCVVVGKHQNTLAEVNFSFIRDQKIPVARRLSGGGTVYHGDGNLNFSFIKKGEKGKLVDFKFFVSPVVQYLESLGVIASIGEKNDLLIDGLKISGNAEHVYKERVLHHGTLLFDAELDRLNRSIEVDPDRFTGKAVQSNRSGVTNIADHLPAPMTFEDFKTGLFNWLGEKYGISGFWSLSEEDDRVIKQLRENKYITREWIWGYSPDFSVKGTLFYRDYQVEIICFVEKGSIAECTLRGDNFPEKPHIISFLSGKPFDYQMLQQNLPNSDILPELAQALLSALFP